jgi:hypothetical protein
MAKQLAPRRCGVYVCTYISIGPLEQRSRARRKKLLGATGTVSAFIITTVPIVLYPYPKYLKAKGLKKGGVGSVPRRSGSTFLSGPACPNPAAETYSSTIQPRPVLLNHCASVSNGEWFAPQAPLHRAPVIVGNSDHKFTNHGLPMLTCRSSWVTFAGPLTERLVTDQMPSP